MSFPARRRDRPEIYPTQSPRAASYDRNPSKQDYSWEQGGVAPHIATNRFSLTVPSGKKGFLELFNVELIRQTAATAAGFPTVALKVRGTNVVVLRMLRNGVGDDVHATVGHSLTLVSGDTLIGWTEDDSTGGTVRYILCASITVFDA